MFLSLQLNLKFEIEVLCKNLSLDINDLKPGTLLKDKDKLKSLEEQLSAPKKEVKPPEEMLPIVTTGGFMAVCSQSFHFTFLLSFVSVCSLSLNECWMILFLYLHKWLYFEPLTSFVRASFLLESLCIQPWQCFFPFHDFNQNSVL